MITKPLNYLNHLASVALKYFFDFDIVHLRDAFTVVFMILPLAQVSWYIISVEFSYSWATVKEDAVVVKNHLQTVIQKLQQELQREKITQFRSQILQLDMWNWRTK